MPRKKVKNEIILSPEQEERLKLKKELFFEPCQSKEELREFLLFFLKLDMPDYQVDELSTSSPLNFIWEVYNTMRTNEGQLRHVVAACRGSGKTLLAATIELLAMIHFRRDCSHISSIKQQSKKCLKYFKKYCRIDVLQQYFTTESTFEFELSKLPKNEFTEKDDARLVTCAATMEGVNGERSNIMVLDETDLVKQEVISEAILMQTPTLCGNFFEPVSVYLSSRKTNSGPIQALIDEYESGSDRLRLHKFSLVDWMKKCEPGTHGEHGVKFWIHKDTLRIIWDKLPDYELETNFIHRVVYEGCRACPAAIVCQGRCPNQKSTSKYLKSIKSVSLLIDECRRDPGKIIAQLLNWRPESTGIVFSSFSRSIHCKTPQESWEWITGQKWTAPEGIVITKKDIYDAAIQMKYDVIFGVDFGYNPDPAVCVVVLHNRKNLKTMILHVRSAKEHANHLWAESVTNNEGKLFKPNLVCPDMADPAAHTYFKGLPTRNKKPMRIESGVSQIRGLLFDPSTQESKFAIAMFDEEAEWAVQGFLKWRHKTSVTGEIDVKGFEDSEWTHTNDSLRYALDPFVKKNNTVIAMNQKKEETAQEILGKPAATNQDEALERYKKIMQSYFNEGGNKVSFDQNAAYSVQNISEPKKEEPKKKGSFSFRF